MHHTATVACLAAAILLTGCSKPPRLIVVAATNTTEQGILGEIVAQHLERRLGVKVDRRMKMDGTQILHESLLSGQVDIYPEYAGAALVTALKLPPGDDPEVADERLRHEYAALHLAWIAPLGFRSGFAMVVRGADARAAKLETLTDAAQFGPGWTIGVATDFMSRADGYTILMRRYGLPLRGGARPTPSAALYPALAAKDLSMIAGNISDAGLSAGDFKILRDDKKVFPVLGAGLAVRATALEERPGLREALQQLVGKFPDDVIRALNREVDIAHRPVPDVAREFLQQRVQ